MVLMNSALEAGQVGQGRGAGRECRTVDQWCRAKGGSGQGEGGRGWASLRVGMKSTGPKFTYTHPTAAAAVAAAVAGSASRTRIIRTREGDQYGYGDTHTRHMLP
jgi:hypothetical protein